ncbi:MAG: HDOD domain-containing protein [Thermoguttaceae bacterium]
MINSATTLDQLAARLGQLYSLPAVAMQVLQLTRNPHVDTRALKECIENDPAISSRILRVVNSSLFGLSREVSDLNHALAMLGIKPLKLLVLGFSLPSGLFLDVESKTLLWYWKHTLTKAVACRELSDRLWRIPGDEAFLAGLFHDLGVLLLFQQLGQPYARFLDRAVTHRLDLCAIEKRAMGFSHTELSARLLQLWSFPESLCNAVAWQPAPQANPLALGQILHLSELFARLFADGQTSTLDELLATGRHYCRRFDQQLEPMVMEVEVKVHELADILALALPDGLEYRDVLAEAHRQMAHVAAQAAEDLLRNRVPENSDPDDDWLFSDLDSLTDALTDVCAAPIECERAAAKAQVSAAPGDADAGLWQPPAAAEPVALRPTVATPSAPPAKTRPAVGSVAPNLLDRLTGIVAACRPARRPVSLLLVKLSAGAELLTACGPQEIATIRQVLGNVCHRSDHPGAICLPHTEFGYALILPGAERQQAIELGNDLIRAVRTLAMSAGVTQKEWLNLDVGVATVAQPPKNFPPRDLLDGADRCLYASHASGSGVVKSIEIY